MAMIPGGLRVPGRDDCPPPAPATPQNPAPTPEQSLEAMVDRIINDALASSTVAIDRTSGSTTISGTFDPRTGLDINVNTPFGGIHLFDPVCKLLVKKIVVGGTATPADFMINVMFQNNHIGGSPKAGSATGTSYNNLTPGVYVVSETGTPTGYTAAFSGDCDATGKVVLTPNGSATCVITNTFATSTATTTPGCLVNCGGGTSTTTPGCTTNCGGGCTVNCDGGGGGCTVNCGSSGTSGGGGGGGGNGPIATGGGTVPGTVAGETISIPEETMLPLIPNTGFGDAVANQLMLLISGVIALTGMALLLSRKRA